MAGILETPERTASYVVPDENAAAVLIVYAVQTVIELLILLAVWKKIGKKINYQEIRETW